MSDVNIRAAVLGDIAAITRIYGEAVARGTATFEVEPPDEAEMAHRQHALLAKGYPYQVVFNATNVTYQVQNLPSGATYQNVGGVVPLAAWPMTFNQNTTINFKPNGMVTATVGSNVFTITYQGSTATITVSNYGNVTVSCSNNTTSC